MAVVKGRLANPLARGFYTVQEAAHLIPNGSTQRIYGWLKGYRRGGTPPLVKRDYPPIGDAQELSFLDLMEVRFIEYFREHGVGIRALRLAAEEARQVFKTDKPFATGDITFRTDGKAVIVDEIFKSAAQQVQDRRLWGLVTKQLELYEFVKASLLEGVAFNPKSQLAERWHPRPTDHPAIIVDPLIAFGQPTVEGKTPTRALFEAWTAEGEDIDAVAYWFELSPVAVKQAVDFEIMVMAEQREAV
jgi:uncharacterized protein (DUF433 family)